MADESATQSTPRQTHFGYRPAALARAHRHPAVLPLDDPPHQIQPQPGAGTASITGLALPEPVEHALHMLRPDPDPPVADAKDHRLVVGLRGELDGRVLR